MAFSCHRLGQHCFASAWRSVEQHAAPRREQSGEELRKERWDDDSLSEYAFSSCRQQQ